MRKLHVLSKDRMKNAELSRHSSEHHTCVSYNDIMLIGMNKPKVVSVEEASVCPQEYRSKHDEDSGDRYILGNFRIPGA